MPSTIKPAGRLRLIAENLDGAVTAEVAVLFTTAPNLSSVQGDTPGALKSALGQAINSGEFLSGKVEDYPALQEPTEQPIEHTDETDIANDPNQPVT